MKQERYDEWMGYLQDYYDELVEAIGLCRQGLISPDEIIKRYIPDVEITAKTIIRSF